MGELLSPVAATVGRELVDSAYIQADETPVGVQMHDGRGKNHQAYLWQYGRAGGSVIVDFRLSRGREGPKQFLGRFQGILQTVALPLMNKRAAEILDACCWAHSRRKYIEALKLHPEDRTGMRIVVGIDELFSIDAEARSANLDHLARHKSRLERSWPLLGLLNPQIEAAEIEALPPGQWARRPVTHFRSGQNLYASWITQNSNLATTWRQTPWGLWPSGDRTGSIWGVNKRDQRWLPPLRRANLQASGNPGP